MSSAPPDAGPAINPYAPPQTESGTSSGDAPTQEEVEAFVGKNHSYYYFKWRTRGRWDELWAGFNWAAAIFNVFWLVYRRMYVEAVVVFAIDYVLDYVPWLLANVFGLQGTFEALSWVFDIALSVMVGVAGNGLYRRRSVAAVGLARRETDPARRTDVLIARGGTRGWAPFLLLLALTAFGVWSSRG